MKVVNALREGCEAFAAPLLLMKEAHDNSAKERPVVTEDQHPESDMLGERGSSDVETLGKMTLATAAALAVGGAALELAGVERTLNMPLGMGVGGLVVGAVIYGGERLLNR